MRNLKKFLALVLVFMMAMSLMVSASAATTSNKEFSDSNDVHEAFAEDLVVVNGMGVIQGYDDGTFKPNATITRAQMAAIVYRMATGDVEDKYASNYVNAAVDKFTDKNLRGGYAWASGYIGYCANADYIVGYPDGTFHPEKEVTGHQALAMILRAMGYNQPGHNYTGGQWSTYVMTDATNRGMLVNIDKTSFGASLRNPAPRQVVAEMAFQGLTKAQVQWTSAYGYQTTGMDGRPGLGSENPSLGYQNFGLTNHKGIVVGNHFTGEGNVTKIGFSLDTNISKGLQIGDDDGTNTGWEVVGTEMKASINDNISKEAYYYLTTNAANGTATDDDKNVTLTFKWDSDLKLFNHAVDVWYDYRGTSTQTVQHTSGTINPKTVGVSFRDNLTTYAVFDRATAHDVVVSSDATLAANLGTAINNTTEMNAPAEAFFNYAFARMNATNWEDEAGTAAYSGLSPIMANDGEDGVTGATDEWPLYLVISNNPGKTADVVITLDLTLSKVVQDNNTQAPLSTGIVTDNDGDAYFDQFDKMTPTNGAPDYSNVANKNRVDSYDAKLGDYVAAIAVTGTNGTKTGVTTGVATATDGNATAAAGPATGTGNNGATNAPMTSTFWYQFTQLTSKQVKSMQKFDKDTQKVYFTDGTSAERSIFALAVDADFQDHNHVMAPLAAGEYTFYFDEEGNWLFWEQASSTNTFVYGTYLDFATKTASSSFNYPMVYTNAAGEEKLQANITRVDGTQMSNTEYGNSMLPKRTTVGDNSSGFTAGQYIGYAMNDGVLTSILNATNNGGTATDAGTGFWQADSTHNTAANGWNDFGYTGTNTTINKQSLAIGAQPVGGDGNLFVTSRTKFVIVDGAGTDNQAVKVYNGMAEFLGDHQSVTIDAATAPVANPGKYINVGTNDFNHTDYAGQDAPWEMVYYSLEQDPYSQNYDMMDKYIDTVFIPAPLVSAVDGLDNSLYFVGDSSFGLIDANNNATQFTFYKNADKSVLWIDGKTDGVKDGTTATDSANIVTELGDNVFYQLHDTGRKAVDGGAIYDLVPFASQGAADAVVIGQFYGDDGTNSADITIAAGKTTITADAHATTGYLATTRNSQVAYVGGRTAASLRNISNANVLNLNGDFTINSIGDLNDQSALTSNQGVSVSCVLGEGGALSFIYVNTKN